MSQIQKIAHQVRRLQVIPDHSFQVKIKLINLLEMLECEKAGFDCAQMFFCRRDSVLKVID